MVGLWSQVIVVLLSDCGGGDFLCSAAVRVMNIINIVAPNCQGSLTFLQYAAAASPTHLTIAILLCGYALLSCKYSMDYCVDTPYYWWHWKPHYQSHTTEPCYIDRGIFWGGAAMEVSALGSTTSNTPLSSVTVVGIDKKIIVENRVVVISHWRQILCYFYEWITQDYDYIILLRINCTFNITKKY